MDSRIQLITNLKDCLSSRNSMAHLTCPESDSQEPSPDDIEYILIKKQIVESTFLKKANRHIKIRLHKWLDYLDKIKLNKVWIKSRNKYIKLLNLMCYCECLIQPYNGLPPEGELPTLRKHQINKIIDQVQHFVKNNIPASKKQVQPTQSYYPEDISQRNQSFYSRESQVYKRIQTYPETFNAEDDTEMETVPMKKVECGVRNRTEACEDSSTLALSNHQFNNKQLLTPTFDKNDVTYRRDNSSLSIERPDKSKVRLLGQNNASIQRKEPKAKRRLPHHIQEKQNKVVCKTLALPPKYKSKPVDDSKLQKQKISAIPKQYWQSLSNSEVHTPKYLSNYSSQLIAIEEQSVQIVSFRGEKEGESCLCTGGKFGDSWLGQIFNKILS